MVRCSTPQHIHPYGDKFLDRNMVVVVVNRFFSSSSFAIHFASGGVYDVLCDDDDT